MEWFRTWLLGIMSAALIVSMVYALVPKGTMRSIAQFTGGLVLMIVILHPLLQFDPSSWKLQYQDISAQIDEQIAVYKEDHQEELCAIIEEETAAYISDKGSELGIDCHPIVTARLRDGVPCPDEVTLDTDWNAVLSRCIAKELDIPAENQHWQGSN